jgi:hypothetical protein
MKKQIQTIALVASALVALAGCRDEVDTRYCEKKFGSQYSQGRARAESENLADYQRGKEDLERTAAETGKADGLAAAYQRGYDSLVGYPKGYDETYAPARLRGKADPKAVTDGTKAGLAEGKQKGAYDGDKNGDQDGAYDGDLNGEADGYDDGYADGYYAVSLALSNGDLYCSSETGRTQSKRKERFAEQCVDQGYRDTRNAIGNYNRGYADAKASNSAYQNAYNQYKADPGMIQTGVNTGYADGRLAGDREGYADGFHETYLVAYNSVYDTAYDSAYYPAYGWAYDDSYVYYYGLAYDEFYEFGYDDGYDDGYYDYCSVYGYGRIGKGAKGGNSRYKASESYLKKRKAVDFAKLRKADARPTKAGREKLTKRLDRARFEHAAASWGRKSLARAHWWLEYRSTEPNGPAYPDDKTPYAERLKSSK